MTVTVDVWRVDARVTGAELRERAGIDDSGGHSSSVTHTRGCTLLAVAPARVGVDVEHVRPRRYLDRLAARAMRPDELARWRAATDCNRAFLQHWTRVEAHLKALGVGVRGGLQTRPDDRWTIVELDLGPFHVGALAIEACRPVAIVWHPLSASGGTSR